MVGKKRSDVDSETAMLVAQEERNLELLKKEQQAKRELQIAQVHEMIGRIQGVKLIADFANVGGLMWLKQVKESKIYRDLPNVGTWEDFCKYIGLSRQKVDEDLLNLATFGEEFLANVGGFSLGYRDLKKLRQLTHDGTITIDADAIVINDERIPLDADHKDDLQAAIESIIDQQAIIKEEMEGQKKAYDRVQNDTRKSMVKLEKELARFTKEAEGKGLSAEEDAFVQLVEKHRILVQGSLIALEPVHLVDGYDGLTVRMKAKAIAVAHEIKMQSLALYDTMVTEIGDATIVPEIIEDFEKWEERNGFK
jgi:hypothetical protein